MKPGKSGLTVMILKDRFQGKTAIVTGGASGIARKISERFVAEGGRIAVFDVQEEAEKALCHNLGDDLARAFVCNVADRACVEDAVNRACEFLGHIDCLFNVAGLPCRNCFLDITDEQFERCFSVNVKGYLNMSRAVGKRMKEQGTGGAIVNFNSISAYLIDDYSVGYTITKGPGRTRKSINLFSTGSLWAVEPDRKNRQPVRCFSHRMTHHSCMDTI